MPRKRRVKMSYYFIVDNYRIGNQEEYEEYIMKVKPIVEAYGGIYLVRTDKVTSMNEARKPDRSIVIQFPDKKMIEQCFSSNEYKKIMNKRIKNVDSRAIIVPGLEEENESTSDKNWFSGNGASKEICICVFNRSTVLLFD